MACFFPSAGEVLVDGKATSAWDPVRLKRHIGYVIQEIGLFPHYTVEQNVGLVPNWKSWAALRIQERVKSAAVAGESGTRAVCRRVIRRNYPVGRSSGSAWRGRWLRIRQSAV